MNRATLGSLLALILLAVTGPVRGQSTDDVQQAEAAIADDRAALTDARTYADSVRKLIASDEAQATEIQRRMAGGAENLPRISADLRAATNDLDTQRAAFDPVRKEYEAARRQLETARQQAMQKYEQSPEFLAASANQQNAAAARKEAEAQSLKSLADSPICLRLQSDVDAAKDRVNYFRQAGPAFYRDVDASSDKLQAATARLDAFKERRLQADPAVRRARQQAASAEAAVADLRQKLQQQIPSDPAVAQASSSLSLAQGPYDAALTAGRQAEARTNAIRAAYQQTVSGMTADRQTLGEVEKELSEARAELVQTNADIDRIAHDLTGALAAVAEARAQQAQSAAATQAIASPELDNENDPLPLLNSAPAGFAAPDDAALPPLDADATLASDEIPAPIFVEPGYLYSGGFGFGTGSRGRTHHVIHRQAGQRQLADIAASRRYAPPAPVPEIQSGFPSPGIGSAPFPPRDLLRARRRNGRRAIQPPQRRRRIQWLIVQLGPGIRTASGRTWIRPQPRRSGPSRPVRRRKRRIRIRGPIGRTSLTPTKHARTWDAIQDGLPRLDHLSVPLG
jgi:hypothetical protein